MAGLFVGISGWNYPEWQDGFYAGVPRRRWLEHYASHFAAVEVNATFYRQLKPETVRRWHDATPADFRFAIKGHRFITHIKRLKDAADPLRRQRDVAAPLGGKLRVVLWQAPAALARDLPLLEGFARTLQAWPEVRHVIELRHRSWFDDASAACLAAHGLGAAISDAARWPRWDLVTSGLAYLRLHGRPQTYASAYDDQALGAWAAQVRAWRAAGSEVHVYFDNTMAGAAPADAVRLLAMLGGPDG
jgi:uncharacterized protein YecE (DUF72 family)